MTRRPRWVATQAMLGLALGAVVIVVGVVVFALAPWVSRLMEAVH